MSEQWIYGRSGSADVSRPPSQAWLVALRSLSKVRNAQLMSTLNSCGLASQSTLHALGARSKLLPCPVPLGACLIQVVILRLDCNPSLHFSFYCKAGDGN